MCVIANPDSRRLGGLAFGAHLNGSSLQRRRIVLRRELTSRGTGSSMISSRLGDRPMWSYSEPPTAAAAGFDTGLRRAL
jgi:hypothetical protein